MTDSMNQGRGLQKFMIKNPNRYTKISEKVPKRRAHVRIRCLCE